MIPTLHVHLLGDFLLVSGGTPVTTVHVPRLQSLLAYLVLHRTAPQNRSHLAFRLWPDSTDAQARVNLRKALHHLRQALPSVDHYLQIDRQSLHWQPSRPDACWTLDVLNVEQALTSALQAEAACFRADVVQTGLSALDNVRLSEVARLVPDLLTRHPEVPRPLP